MITAPTLFALHPPQPKLPSDKRKVAAGIVVELLSTPLGKWADVLSDVAGFDYVQRDIVRNWVALDGGRRP